MELTLELALNFTGNYKTARVNTCWTGAYFDILSSVWIYSGSDFYLHINFLSFMDYSIGSSRISSRFQVR